MLPKLHNSSFTCVLLVLLLCATTSLFAQTAERRNNIQLYGSGLSYKGEVGTQFWKAYGVGAGASFNKYLSPSFDFGVHLSYGESEFNFQSTDNFDNKIGLALVGFRMKMYGSIINEHSIIGPYLSLAAGAMHTRSAGASKGLKFEDDFLNGVLAPGAGIRIKVTDTFSAFSEVNYLITGVDKFDGVEGGDNDSFLQYKLGIGINLGSTLDTDKDGVPDRKDSCPKTPSGVEVDKYGCPIDTDGDGVADYQDKCPAEAGVANLSGCPDKDSDGIADRNDQCPDQPGTAATKGCPDTDGDGVADKDDQCPDTQTGTRVGPNGCAVDTDGDCVSDDEDLCPNTPGTIEAKGCPELNDQVLKLIEEKVRFEFNQASVQDTYKTLLDSIVVTLEAYPNHVLLIKGHTDNVGSEEYNQALSEARAQAVKEYLVERGVQNPDRLVTRGYGESQPLVKIDERLSKAKTARERAINRRVGFELNTPDMQLNMD